MDLVYKLITQENYEIIAEFLEVNYGGVKSMIGKHASWIDNDPRDIPQWVNWVQLVPAKHMTVTDGYLADGIVARRRREAAVHRD